MTHPPTSTAAETWSARAPGGDRALARRYRLWRRVEVDLAAGTLALEGVDDRTSRIDLDDVLIVAGLSTMRMIWAPIPMPMDMLGRVRIITEDATYQVALDTNDNTVLFKLLAENCAHAVVIWRQGHVHTPDEAMARLGDDRRTLAANQARMLLREQWELQTVRSLLMAAIMAMVMAVIGAALDMHGAAIAMVGGCIGVAAVLSVRRHRRMRRTFAALPARPTEE